MILKLILSLFLIFSCSLKSYAQTKTPYEKKKEEISYKYLKKLGISTSEIERAKKSDESGFVLLLLVSQQILELEYTDPPRAFLLMTEMEKEMKNAEKLRTKQDDLNEKKILQNERRENERRENELKINELKRKNAERLENEKKMKKDLYYVSDYHKIISEIKNKFILWATKDEYEKSSNYLMRLNNKKNIYDSICYEVIESRIKEINYLYSSLNGPYKSEMYSFMADGFYVFEFESFDADNEKLSFSFKKEIDEHNISNYSVTYNNEITVNVEYAKELKNEGGYFKAPSENRDINFSKVITDWCFYENFLFPNLITINNKYKINLDISKFKVGDIIIETNDLQLNDFFIDNHTFNLNNHLEKIKIKNEIIEKEIAESIFRKQQEEEKRIKKEQEELERKKQIEFTQLSKKGDDFVTENKLKLGLGEYYKAKVLYSDNEILNLKISDVYNRIFLTDSLEKFRNNKLQNLQNEIYTIVNDTLTFFKLQDIKKSISKNYQLCIKSFDDTIKNQLRIYLTKIETRNKDVILWNDLDKESLVLLETMALELNKMQKFKQIIDHLICLEDKKTLKKLTIYIKPSAILETMLKEGNVLKTTCANN